jgi:diacylglycerol kinase family enzyme
MDTPMSRAAVVVNPTKVDDDDAFRKSVRQAMDHHCWDEPLWLETTPEDPGRGQAKSAASARVDLVLACGGDGTSHRVRGGDHRHGNTAGDHPDGDR